MPKKKDMARADWTRILAKRQIIRDFAHEGMTGKISLMKIEEISEPLTRRYEGEEIVLFGKGFYWLQLAVEKAHAWYTVMYDEAGQLVQIYVDITDGNDTRREIPVFEDMYLDYVLHGDKVYELDRDELDAAYSSGDVTRRQYETALAEGEKVRSCLTAHPERVRAFFAEQFNALRKELDVTK